MESPRTSLEARIAALTDSQRLAVMAQDRALCVLAGAGAGKTQVLTLRVAHMVESGTAPEHIRVITFSRKAAQELRDRLYRFGIRGVSASTFHRLGLDLITTAREAEHRSPPTVISDRRGRIARLIGGKAASSNAASVDAEIAWARSQGLDRMGWIDAVDSGARRSLSTLSQTSELWARYEELKTRSGLVDFDDLIEQATQLLAQEQFGKAMRWRSRHLLVDEFQDLNPAQYGLLKGLMDQDSSLFCVGDPNQSIYGFAGANPSLLGELGQRIEHLVTINLEANHRSSPEIVAVANAVLTPDQRRPARATQSSEDVPDILSFDNEEQEAGAVAKLVRQRRAPGSAWSSIAVLARTNYQLETIAGALRTARIPIMELGVDTSPGSDLNANTSLPSNGQAEDGVVLSTFHRAKGLEWPHVIVVGVADGLVPHANVNDVHGLLEERRLLYVAMTRAERDLTITWARRRSHNSPIRQRSGFLDEVELVIRHLNTDDAGGASARGAMRIAKIRAELQELQEKSNTTGA